jgi:hypothetical protein
MIDFKLDEKQNDEKIKRFKKEIEGIGEGYSHLFFPEVDNYFRIDLDEYFDEYKDDVRLVVAYKIIGRAMVFGVCEFQSVGGDFCKLFRNDEDFCLVLVDAMREKSFKDSEDLCKELIKLL